MPSGRTHDRITLWSLPLVAGATFGQTRSSSLTLLVSTGFLIGGLMFGPDLDIYSRQYQRWGWFRWIWLPYRKLMRHRSFWSHGPIVGTVLRLAYLGVWLSAVSWVCVAIASGLGYPLPDLPTASQYSQQWILQYSPEIVAACLGLEIGALSHASSDWIGSAYKRYKNHGWQGVWKAPAKKRKRKSTRRSQTTQPKTRNTP